MLRLEFARESNNVKQCLGAVEDDILMTTKTVRRQHTNLRVGDCVVLV